MTVYERIENLRKKIGYSQGKLEKELGFSNGSISKWKSSMPNPERLQKLADFFNVSLQYLMTGEEKEGGETYYLNDETREIAQEIFENKELRMLFDVSRKRKLPKNLVKIGVISSVQAAGYADFVKIINKRWGGMKVLTAHTQVQGLDAPDQIIRALKYFNDNTDVQVIAIIRGGGSADDLSCFNDEALVRAIASSKIPVITGIGHEVDESLCDLAADVRASTPSNVAELLTRDRVAEKAKLERMLQQMLQRLQSECSNLRGALKQRLKILEAMNPEKVLKQGYAIVAGETSLGSVVKITTFDKEMKAEIKMIKERS
jgi:exodeoxyribonuclease VII large subunit